MIILDYFLWHYGRAIKQGLNAWKNILWFFANFFSITLLLKTLFQPWKRIFERSGQGFDPGRFFEAIIINTMMRLVGFVMRSIVLIIGIATEIIAVFLGILFLCVWLAGPFLLFPLIILIPIFYFIKIEPKRTQKAIMNFAVSHLEAGLLSGSHASKKEDLDGAIEWGKNFYEKKRKKSRWWLKENLARVPGIGKDWCYGATYVLDQYSHEFVCDGPMFDLRAAGYEQQILAIESALCRTKQANVLLVGEPGTAKRSVVCGFVDLLRRGKIHPALEHKRAIELDANTLAASAKTKGELEELLLKIFDEAVSAGNIILIIDNFGKFIKSAEGMNVSIGQLLAPYFNSSFLQFLAMEDTDDFKRIIETNSGLAQYFEITRVKEPDEKELARILEDIAPAIESAHRIIITYPALKKIATAAKRYLTEGVLPERAIDILEEVSARVASSRKSDFVGAKDVLDFVKEKTKMSVGELEDGEKEKLSNLEEILHQRVVNQHEAISAISGAVRRARMGVHDPKKPIGSFLFLGPTGVGKTETAKALSEIYFGSEDAMLRFDMTEYQEEGGVERLIGNSGINEPGILSSAIREKPYNLILLDEFEKSNRKIMDLFLQILDEGFFTDGFGKKVFTRNSIIIATSNAASRLIWDMVKDDVNPVLSKEKIIDFIQKQGIFKAELLNRFDAIVIFEPLKQEHLKVISKLMLEKLNKRLLEKDLELVINEPLIEKVAEMGYDPLFGARPMRRVIQEKIEERIAKRMISGELKPGAKIEFSAEELEKD